MRSKVFAKAKFLGEFINDGTPAVIEGEAHEVAEETPESGGTDTEQAESTNAEISNNTVASDGTETEDKSESKPGDAPDAE